VGLTKVIWDKLSQYEQDGWDRLTDAHKALIIQYGMAIASNAPPPLKERLVQQAERICEDDDVDDAKPEFDSDDNHRLAYETNISDTPSPGSLESLLGRLAFDDHPS
jgi:hypothetical protein